MSNSVREKKKRVRNRKDKTVEKRKMKGKKVEKDKDDMNEGECEYDGFIVSFQLTQWQQQEQQQQCYQNLEFVEVVC